MITTPIHDFVQAYSKSHKTRLHMPGHKGISLLGCEALDITEISGADSLYEADGIIAESERNASILFGADTFYSPEGSSLAIRAMLYLALLDAKKNGRSSTILAARNVHKTFLSGCALLDLNVDFLRCGSANSFSEGSEIEKKEMTHSYLSAGITGKTLRRILSAYDQTPAAVYLTSPDYLGTLQPVHELAEICHEYGTLLLVDNAHGAYLHFLNPSLHPLDLGADMCCDSAHKTLPTLTGGAYLQLSSSLPSYLKQNAKHALALFASTSPSYLILQSLDLTNRELEHYPERLREFQPAVDGLKERLIQHGYILCSEEPIKLTIQTKPSGYRGDELAQLLEQKGFVCEFADQDYLVYMLTPCNSPDDLARLGDEMCSIQMQPPVHDIAPVIPELEQVLSIREAMLAIQEQLPVEKCCGRILAQASVGCPPAVPIAICGQRLTKEALECFQYYGIDTISVVAE